jgi:hypothetical protein
MASSCEHGRRPETDNIKINLKEKDEKVWTGLIWLKVGTYGELL